MTPGSIRTTSGPHNPGMVFDGPPPGPTRPLRLLSASAPMSVLRPRPPEDPLTHDAGLTVAAHADRLASLRDRIVAAPRGVDLAARVLAAYDTRRPDSGLLAILTAARRIRDAVDRLVVVAGGGIAPATRLLVATCCHPFHDQLTRGERGGRPRISWLDGGAGNDAIRGLLDVLTSTAGPGDDLLDRWALMAIDVPPDDPAQTAIVESLLDALVLAVDQEHERLPTRFVPLAAAGSRVAGLGSAVGCRPPVTDVADLGGPQGVFTAAGLLPAAVAGIDVVRLLKGAAAMLRRFAEAPPAENPALVDAAVAWRAASDEGRTGRAFIGPGRWLAELSAWHGDLRPVAAGAASIVTAVLPGEPRRERLAASAWTAPAADPAGTTCRAPDVVIGLPRLDEHAIGQLLQLLILSAAVEAGLREGI